jgi:hypothetical protein
VTYTKPPYSSDTPQHTDDGVTLQPYYVRDTQSWAVDQERQRHSQALLTIGEYALFVLMWHINDQKAGLVSRCTKCYSISDPIKRKIAETYNQPEQHRCPSCFGTTFQGGYKAQIVRPAIFSDADEDEQKQARGVTNPQDLAVESTPDFRVRSGDYVFRATGDRYQLRVPNRVTVRTGFAVPHQSTAAIGYNHARASQEDQTSVAYIIPPDPDSLERLLTRGAHWPYDFRKYEVIRAPLIPNNALDSD